jgi:hypothetical protein
MIQIRKEAIMILSKTYVMLFFKKLLKKTKKVSNMDYQPVFNALWFHKVEELRRVP